MAILQLIKGNNFALLDNEIKNIPFLSEKVMFDLINGIEITEEQLRVRSTHRGLVRLLSFVNGSSERRQQIIDQTMQKSVEALAEWMEFLTKHSSFTVQTLTRITKNLEVLIGDLEKHMAVTESNRYAITRLENNFAELEGKLKQITIRLNANDRIHYVFASWNASQHYKDYPSLVQAVFALNDLARGEEGQYIFQTIEYRNRVINETISALRRSGIEQDFLSLEKWVTQFGRPEKEHKQLIVSYLVKKDDNQFFHRLLAEYAESGNIPNWLEIKQQVEVPVVLSTRLLINKFATELVRQTS